MKSYLDYCLTNGLNSDLSSSLEAFKKQKTKKSTLNDFYFTVAVWTKYGDLKTRRVIVKAKDESQADDKINKRYPNAYDISK